MRDYIPPHEFMKHPLAQSKMFEALYSLGRYYWEKHEHGFIPAFEGLKVKITLKNLSEEEKNKLIPDSGPPNVSWLFYKFEIEEEWKINLKRDISSIIADSKKTILEFLDNILVCDEEAYNLILRYELLPADVGVFFPVPIVLSPLLRRDDSYKSFLKGIKYITNAQYIITRNNAQVKVTLEDLHKSKFEEELTKLLRGFEKLLNEYQKPISDGVFQILRKPNISDIKGNRGVLEIPRGEQAEWTVEFNYTYILPVEVRGNEGIIWDQKIFTYIFSRIIVNIDSIEFCKDESLSEIKFEDHLSPLLQFAIAGPLKPNLAGNCWKIENRDKIEYVYPGDSIIFLWAKAQ